MALKPYRKSLVTPEGTAIYPWLTEPDSRFGDPTYKVNLRISGDAAKAFVAKVEEVKAEAVVYLQQDNPKLTAENFKVPLVEAKDESGNTIPDTWDVKAKTKAFYKKADGSMAPMKFVVVDAQKNEMDKDTAIWGGSKLKLALNIGAVSTAIYSGLMFRINGVQVLELVTGGGNAASMFDKEDGYVAEEKVNPVELTGDEDIDF